MKKFLLSLLAVAGLTATASALTPEIQLSYGGYTQMDATDMHGGFGKVNNAWGALTAGVYLPVAPKIDAGVSYTFSSSSFKDTNSSLYYHVVMVNGRYQYYSNSIVKLYAKVGLGVDITHFAADGISNKSYFAYQVTPVGAKVDLSRGFGIFGELGFGAQGLLQVGVTYKF
ncbi:MAG: porin family protein [Bacteroides sp.]|nr:porin family protein [Bacteroidales bacterium]MBD5250311.1 porin family protein [Barnesiella sp.]MBD5253550.1 porin family protein [Barnesiella sp.]MBD5368789.1 porin family protein [Bacteroides sp.]